MQYSLLKVATNRPMSLGFNEDLAEEVEKKYSEYEDEILEETEKSESYLLMVFPVEESNILDEAFKLLKNAVDTIDDFALHEVWLIDNMDLTETNEDGITPIDDAYNKLSKLIKVRKVRQNQINELCMAYIDQCVVYAISTLNFRSL